MQVPRDPVANLPYEGIETRAPEPQGGNDLVANLPYEGIGTAAPPAFTAGGVRLDRARAKKQEAGVTAHRQEPIRKISQIRPIAPSIVFFFYRFISARYGGWC